MANKYYNELSVRILGEYNTTWITTISSDGTNEAFKTTISDFALTIKDLVVTTETETLTVDSNTGTGGFLSAGTVYGIAGTTRGIISVTEDFEQLRLYDTIHLIGTSEKATVTYLYYDGGTYYVGFAYDSGWMDGTPYLFRVERQVFSVLNPDFGTSPNTASVLRTGEYADDNSNLDPKVVIGSDYSRPANLCFAGNEANIFLTNNDAPGFSKSKGFNVTTTTINDSDPVYYSIDYNMLNLKSDSINFYVLNHPVFNSSDFINTTSVGAPSDTGTIYLKTDGVNDVIIDKGVVKEANPGVFKVAGPHPFNVVTAEDYRLFFGGTTVKYDIGNNFNVPTGQFVAPTDGVYDLTVEIMYDLDGDMLGMFFKVYVETSLEDWYQITSETTSGPIPLVGVQWNTCLELSAGNVVEFFLSVQGSSPNVHVVKQVLTGSRLAQA